MQRWSRRRTLHAVAATASVALAGCNDSTERSGSPGRRRDGDPVTDYEAESVRDADGRPLFWRDEADDGQDDERRRERGGIVLLTDPVAESDLVFAADVPAADALQSFAADTDFETQSVLLYTTRVSGCRRLRLEGVRRQEAEVDVSLCRVFRPADVACDADADHTGGVGIRLPFPIDDANGSSVHVGSRCRDTPEPVTVDEGDDS